MSHPTPREIWHARAADRIAAGLDGRLLIDGRRYDPVEGRYFDCVSPIDGKVLTRVARAQAADVDLAVTSARAAFADGRWSARSPGARKKVLLAFAERMLAAREELALLETLDMGKPIANALAIDVPAAARCIQWYAEAVDKVYGEVAPTARNALGLVTREPVGVVGAIVPWNYPLLMAAWKIAPALAAGNSVVLKPSEKSPLTALRLGELALEAGLPDGVLNVVPGFGDEAGEALALHMGVDAIGFTGSTRVGRRMLEYAGRSNLKRVYNELGGKSANIVFADFDDLARAAETAAAGIFDNQGESCNAPSRLLVQRDIADEMVERLRELAPVYAPADPLDPQTRLGALVDENQTSTVMGYIRAGLEQGAHCVAGGTQELESTGGQYVAPTIFDRVRNDMRIAREEIFGPVLSVLRFDTEAEALALANDSRYGLNAGVWTRNLDRAVRMARGLHAGTVHINQYDEDDMTVPFGGVKESGNGRDKSLHALDKYSELKTTWMRIDPA